LGFAQTIQAGFARETIQLVLVGNGHILNVSQPVVHETVRMGLGRCSDPTAYVMSHLRNRDRDRQRERERERERDKKIIRKNAGIGTPDPQHLRDLLSRQQGKVIGILLHGLFGPLVIPFQQLVRGGHPYI
jgi:hypothetical protein